MGSACLWVLHLEPAVADGVAFGQAAIARSAKWGTTEPPLRPVPLRQGSAPGPLDATPSPSGSAGPSPGKPPLAATEGQQRFPKMSKLDALLMQQQQQQQNSGSSSGGDAKQTMSSPGALGTHPSVGSDQMLHHASSAGQLGAIGTQVCFLSLSPNNAFHVEYCMPQFTPWVGVHSNCSSVWGIT